MRDFKKFYKDHTERTILESVMVPEIVSATRDWFYNNSDAILIGGLALSYWAKPRETGDIDVLFQSDAHIPATVAKFNRHRAHAFEHNDTGVEVEVLSPEFIDMEDGLYDKVLETSEVLEGIRIASPTGIVALKLGRSSPVDIGDISTLLDAGHKIDLNGWPVDENKLLRAEDSLNMTLRK